MLATVTADARPLRPIATLIALTGLNLLDYLDRQLLGAVLTPLKEEMGFSDHQLGTLQTAFMLGYFLTAPIFGYLGDKCSRRTLIAAGVVVWSLGTLLTGHGNAFLSLLIFRVLVGLGEASFGTISPGWIADLFPPAKRNFAISIFYLAIPVGSAIGYIVGSAIAAHHGWRAAFLWAGYPGLLLAFVLYLFREPPRGASDVVDAAHARPSAGLKNYLLLWTYPRYTLVVAGYTAQTFALGGFALWAPTFLYRVHGMSVAQAGLFFGGTLVVTGLVATLVGGWLATLWQRKNPTGYARMLALAAILAVPVSFAAFLLDNKLASQLCLAASMFLLFLPTGPINTLILETVPVAFRASAMAASIFTIHLLGDLWSPAIVGYLSDRTGSLQQAVLILPLALVVSAVLWIALARLRPTPPAEL